MRTTLLALLASAVTVSATGCAQNTIEELVERTSCGCSQKITKCLQTSADLYRLDQIEDCYKEGGCNLVDAIVGATWFASECHQYNVEDVREDLRRRADTTTSTDTTTAKTTSKTTTAKTTATTSTESTSTTSSESSTEATTTTSSSSSTSSVSTTLATTVSSTTSTSSSSTSSTSTTSNTAASATTTGTLLCSTTKTTATSICSTPSGAKTTQCVATTTAIASCAAGLICFSSTAGADVCMKKDNHLTTSGLVVTIVFAVALVGTILAIIIVSMRANKKAKANKLAVALAAASSKTHDDTANPFERSEANLPLITPEGARSEHPYYGGQQDYFPEGQGPDAHGAPGTAPKLHPGLGALGQDTHY